MPRPIDWIRDADLWYSNTLLRDPNEEGTFYRVTGILDAYEDTFDCRARKYVYNPETQAVQRFDRDDYTFPMSADSAYIVYPRLYNFVFRFQETYYLAVANPHYVNSGRYTRSVSLSDGSTPWLLLNLDAFKEYMLAVGKYNASMGVRSIVLSDIMYQNPAYVMWSESVKCFIGLLMAQENSTPLDIFRSQSTTASLTYFTFNDTDVTVSYYVNSGELRAMSLDNSVFSFHGRLA